MSNRKIPFQVYLSAQEEEILRKASELEGLTKSDIIRRLIRRLDFRLTANSLGLDRGLIIDDHLNNQEVTTISGRDIKRP